MTRYILLLITLLIPLNACQSATQSVNCAQIQRTIALSHDFTSVRRNNFDAWLQAQAPTEWNSRVEADPEVTSVANEEWNPTVYQPTFSREILTNITVRFDSETAPTAATIVECLGPPQFYHALYIGKQFELTLFYPQQGLIVNGSTGTTFPTPPHDPRTTPSYRLVLVAPGSLEETVNAWEPNNPSNLEMRVQQSQPWTGSWDTLIVVEA